VIIPDIPIKAPRKLIEVALPLNAINQESARRKRKAPAGYPTTLHKWWAQRPVAAARAVIFGQLVNDPSWKWELAHPGEVPPNNLKASWAKSRKRLFSIIEDLVKWENTNDEGVLEKARAEIRKSWTEVCELNSDHPQATELFDPQRLPSLHDPFAGGGSIPMEAQRLGLEAFATDLNPVAVLINKAMIEIPPIFANQPPIGPLPAEYVGVLPTETEWHGPTGMAEDVRRYGAWVGAEAGESLGSLYPFVSVTADAAKTRPDLRRFVGKNLTVVACLWARTIKSPSPAFRHVDVPLVSTFILSSNSGKEICVRPVIKGDTYEFTLVSGPPPPEARRGTSAGKRAAFRCLLSDAPIDYPYIRAEATAGRMGARLMAIVADSRPGRVYLNATPAMETIAASAQPTWKPEFETQGKCRVNIGLYGLTTWDKLFTPRQLVSINTLVNLITKARSRIHQDACLAGMIDDGKGLDSGGKGATAYAEAISLYLCFAVDRVVDYGSSIATWRTKDSAMRSTLASQSIPMTWDYAEGSPLAKSSAGFLESVTVVARAIEFLVTKYPGHASQCAAQTQTLSKNCVISTDPPYYDNIAYADLSDFFYVWLRRALREVFPLLLATLAVPKAEELVATPYRHGDTEQADAFFLSGMTQAMQLLAAQANPSAPLTIYYAFKQSETENEVGTSSAGWQTFLEAVHRAGLAVTGTWPMRTEGDNRQIGLDANALASSVILVCRCRPANAPTTSRRDFIRELNAALPEALDGMTKGSGDDRSPIAPVDLSQAIIGPGMAIFSKYSAVLEADGSAMGVRTALQLINRFLAEDDFDPDTQFCLDWFGQHGWTESIFGEADVLARSKSTSVDAMKDAGVIKSGGGKVRLLKWSEYPVDWDPRTDKRIPVWEALHQLIRALKQDGESASGALLASFGGKAEAVRQLAYRLYTLCERLGQAEDARAYNELITSWTGIEAAASSGPSQTDPQGSLF
jgi:putative DNA methylase